MTTNTTAPECPECERLHSVAPQSQQIGEFLEWLQNKGFVLAEHHDHSEGCYDENDDRVCDFLKDELTIVRTPIEKLLAEFFNINLVKVENERRALLDFLGNQNQQAPGVNTI